MFTNNEGGRNGKKTETPIQWMGDNPHPYVKTVCKPFIPLSSEILQGAELDMPLILFVQLSSSATRMACHRSMEITSPNRFNSVAPITS
jgi:hypothetical protein